MDEPGLRPEERAAAAPGASWRGAGRSLRFYLVALVLAGIVPMLAFGAAMVVRSASFERAATQRYLTDSTVALSLDIDRQFTGYAAVLTTLAGSRRLADNDLEGFYKTLQRAAPVPGSWLVLTAASGQELLNTRVPFGTTLPMRREEGSFRRALATGQPTVSDLFRAQLTDAPVINFDMPVRRDGVVAYTLSLVLPATSFTAILHDQRLPPTWMGALFDRNGITIARTRDVEKLLGTPGKDDIVAAIKAQTAGLVRNVTREGVAVYNAFTRSEVTGWTVVVGAPQTELDMPIWRSLAWTLAGGAVLLLLAAGMALAAGRRVAHPVAALAEAATRVGRGGKPPRIATKIREIRSVAAALAAADTRLRRRDAELRRLNETLEAQVVERTAELTDKEARLRTIFATSYAYQGLLNPDGTLLDANPTSLAGIGAAREDVLGRPFWETPWFTGTPGMSDTIRAAVARVAGGDTVRREIRLNLPVGGWRWFDFQLRPVRDPDGVVVAILPEAVEITERRQAEEALRQAQKMEAIGHLTGGIAHDFNNLLQVVTGNLDSLRRRLAGGATTPGEIQRFADAALRATLRAATLTQQLLAFARRQPLQPKPLDVNRLVAGMSDLLRRTLGERTAVETILAGGLWRISADANQLENALLNLALNARDAIDGTGKLTIETANTHLDDAYASVHDEVRAGQYVMIAVSDNGRGMPKDVIARAFEPFFTTKEVGRGTGLGLSQVYGFMKQSGGHAKIYSEPGQGTTVRLYLPRLAEPDTAALEPAKAMPPAERPDASVLVLVVEDDDEVRAHTIEMLRDLGCAVLQAAEGEAALRLVEERGDIGLLFTDVGLPGVMNGRQLADAARARRAALKVLFTTGYARNAIVHHGRLDPGLDLIVKPFDYAALAAKLRAVIGA